MTRRGKPPERVERQAQAKPKPLLGFLKGHIEIVDPNDDLSTWDEEAEKHLGERLQRTEALIAPLKRRKRVR